MLSLDPDPETMRRTGYAAVDLAVQHLSTQREQRVARRYSASELAACVDEPLPETGLGAQACLLRFFTDLLPHAVHVNHPRFFAYVPGPGSWAGALGEFAAAATNLFVGTWLGGAAMVRLELLVLDWLRQALGLPSDWTGVVTSGGSLANLGALAAALSRRPHERARAVVYVSSETHYSMTKAARVLGIAQVRALPVSDDLTLAPATLAAAMAQDQAAGLWPAFVCANAGSTTTGAIDPTDALAAVCRPHDAWLHVDGAYGGALALLPEHRARLGDLSAAHSLTLDPHKGLYAPFECGCLLTPHPDALRAAFAAGAPGYLQDVPAQEVNFFERGPELSRGNRALKLWFVLRACGLSAVRDAIRKDLALARQARNLLAADPRFVIVTEPSVSVFTFALRQGEAATQALLEQTLADGFLMLSSSRVHGRYVLRLCVVNARTTAHDIEEAVARLRALAS
jgi:glutamate/tyrosine decarboxylase-like PLP-dependent enzyme